MATRHRDLMPAVVDRENLNIKHPKAQLTKPTGLIRRPALDELSNKINTAKPTVKNEDHLKETKAAAKAPHPLKKELVKSYSTNQIDTVIDDGEAAKDPQMVCEYLGDIFEYLRNLETKFPIKENFLQGHQSSPRMRAILVNWLVQVHTNFSLCLETLHMCVSLIDRYLQENPQVGRESLQLVGTSALLVASKYEEMYLPQLSDFVYICDNSFSKQQILKMEMSILMCLDCNLGKPLSIHFLRRFSKLARVRVEHHNLSKYLLELALLDHNMSSIKPSFQAAAACCFSLAIINSISCPSKVWTEQLAIHTGCKYSDFKHVIVKFAKLLIQVDTSKQKYIQQKYAEAKYSKISTHPKLKGWIIKKMAQGATP